MKDRLKHLWDSILERVSAHVNAQSFQTWFKPTRLVSCEDGHLVIEGPNPFFVDWLAEHHRDKIEHAARETLGEPVIGRVRRLRDAAARFPARGERGALDDRERARRRPRTTPSSTPATSSTSSSSEAATVSPTRRRSPSPTIPRAPTIRSSSTAARGSARRTSSRRSDTASSRSTRRCASRTSPRKAS